MSYKTQNAITMSSMMHWRVAAAAAQEDAAPDNPDGTPGDPDAWAHATKRYWAAAPGWSEAWESALASHPDDPTYDPGSDEAVITDGMILSQVQAMTGTGE